MQHSQLHSRSSTTISTQEIALSRIAVWLSECTECGTPRALTVWSVRQYVRWERGMLYSLLIRTVRRRDAMCDCVQEQSCSRVQV
jgi:hypothetical protein